MNESSSNVHVWAIVPAAGLSRRMGRPKQLLPNGGSTLVASITATLLEAGVAGAVVVTRTALAGRLRLPDDPRVLIAINDDPETEMLDSIRLGLAALDQRRPRDGDGIMVTPADVPELTAGACRACIATFRAAPSSIVVATHKGRRGHPMVFPVALRGELSDLEGGLRLLPRAHPDRLLLVELDDPAVTRDIDTPADLDQLSAE